MHDSFLCQCVIKTDTIILLHLLESVASASALIWADDNSLSCMHACTDEVQITINDCMVSQVVDDYYTSRNAGSAPAYLLSTRSPCEATASRLSREREEQS